MKQRINLNLIPNGVAQVIHLSQNDYINGELEFFLFYGSTVLADPISNAMIKGLKPDGNIFLYNATNISGNVVTFDVKEQMTVISGDVPCKIRIQTADGAKHSKTVILRCEADPTADRTVSESVINAVEELIERITEDTEIAQTAADRAEQGATGAGWMFFEIVDGNLIMERTRNVAVDFYLENGDLIMEAV